MRRRNSERTYVLRATKRSGGLALVLGSAALLAACGGSGESIATPSGSVHVQSNSSGSKVTVQTNKGSDTISGSSKLPSNFPSGIPLPPGIRLTGSIATNEPGKSGFSLTYSFDGSLAREVAAYNRELSAHGYVRSSGFTYSGGVTELWKSSPWSISVIGAASAAGSKNSLLVTVTAKASG